MSQGTFTLPAMQCTVISTPNIGLTMERVSAAFLVKGSYGVILTAAPKPELLEWPTPLVCQGRIFLLPCQNVQVRFQS